MEYVQTDRNGPLATITVDRKEKGNALNKQLIEELLVAFDELKDSDSRIIFLQTAGSDVFISGADLNDMYNMDDKDEFLSFQRDERKLNELIQSHPSIVISIIDGITYGGGFELALATDMIVASKDSKFAFPEVTRGLSPAATGGAIWLPRIIGYQNAIEMLVTGSPITASEAKELGIVNKVTSDDELQKTANDLADEILQNGPMAVRVSKQLCMRSVYGDTRQHLSYGEEQIASLFESKESTEGINAFIEDREPDFE